MAKKDKEKGGKATPKNFYKGLTFKEFKAVGRLPLQMNDVAWAGRLYTKYPFWFKRLTMIIFTLCLVTVICLGLIWVSILMRSPSLLLGVYPQGQVVCFPRLFNSRGQSVPLDKDYHELCGLLDQRAGMMWQVNNAEALSNTDAVGDVSIVTSYDDIAEAHNTLERNKQQSVEGPSVENDLSASQNGGWQ